VLRFKPKASHKETMSEKDFISNKKIAIAGLGLMGGSLAMALRGKCRTLVGIDPDPQARKFAIKNKAVDVVFEHLEEGIPEGEVIILAAPINAIIKTIESLPDIHPGRAFVVDIGSTKVDIVKAMAQLPERFTAMGGHPICGKEKNTIANAEAKLFSGAKFVFTPAGSMTKEARQFAQQLAATIGATPVWLSAEEHDQILALTSHVPYLLAAALTASTPQNYKAYAGPGYQSATRLAATPSKMMMEILFSNRENTIGSLERVQEQINSLLKSLKEDDSTGLRIQLDEIAHNMDADLRET
jgi:prephenate dehydrogenase